MATTLEALLKIRALVTGEDGLRGLAQQLGNVEKKAESLKGAFRDTLKSASWQAAAVGAASVGVSLGYSMTKAVEFDRQLADVRKAIDFTDGKQSLKEFSDELVNLSTQLPYTADELAKIASSAGFAGYAREEIVPFVEDAARMGVAFQMTAEQAGDAMVAMRAAMKLTQPEVRKLADAINYLSDKFKGTVSGADLTEVTRRVGAIGVASGLTAEQVAGLGAAFLASGTPAEVAATGLKNFLKALTLGANTSKVDAFNWAKLFNIEGSKKEMEAAGFGIAASIAKGMQENPELTIKKVLEKISALPADQRISIAGAIFGQESIQSITPILTNLDLVAQAFDLVRDKTAFAGSMQKEFANQMQSSGAQLQTFKNGMDAIAITLGSAVLPPLNALLKAITPLLVMVSSAAQQFPILTGAVVALVAALAGLVAAAPFIASFISLLGMIGAAGGIGALAAGVLGTIAGWLGVVGPLFAALGGIVGVVGSALGAFGSILLGIFSGPVGWVALLVAAGVAVYAFRDQIGEAFRAAAAMIGSVIQPAWEAFTGWIQGRWQFIAEGFMTYVVQPLEAAWQGLAQTMQGVLTGILRLIQGQINVVIQAINLMIAGFNRVRALVGKPAISALPLMNLPGFATGGFITDPTIARFAEREPEYAIPASRMAAASANYLAGARGNAVLSRQAVSGNSQPISISINNKGPTLQANGENWTRTADVGRIVSDAVRKALRNPETRAQVGMA